MSITFRGWGTFSSGTTTAAPDWPVGSIGDAIIALVGNKPYTSTPTTTDGTFSQQATGTSGSVASGVSTGSVRCTSYLKTATATGTGTVTFTTTSGTPSMGRACRLGVTSGLFTSTSVVLADTDETLVTVSATGSVAAGAIAAGDQLVIAVALKDDAITHTIQSLAVAGCTLGAITWQAVNTTTTGNDGGMYFGTCAVTAGSSTGSVTYTATSNTSGASATAVAVTRVREIVPPNAPTGFSATDTLFTSVDTSWTAPGSGTTPDNYTVYRQRVIPDLNGTFDTDISGWTSVDQGSVFGTLTWETADQALRMTWATNSPKAYSVEFPVTPGNRLKVQGDIKRVTGVDRSVRVVVEYLDSGGALLSTYSWAAVTSTAVYQTVGGTWSDPVPVGAVTARIGATSFGAASGDAFVVDNMSAMEQATFTGITGTSYSDTTAVPGFTYTYWVLGTSGGYEGTASSTDTGTRLIGAGPPYSLLKPGIVGRVRATLQAVQTSVR